MFRETFPVNCFSLSKRTRHIETFDFHQARTIIHSYTSRLIQKQKDIFAEVRGSFEVISYIFFFALSSRGEYAAQAATPLAPLLPLTELSLYIALGPTRAGANARVSPLCEVECSRAYAVETFQRRFPGELAASSGSNTAERRHAEKANKTILRENIFAQKGRRSERWEKGRRRHDIERHLGKNNLGV